MESFQAQPQGSVLDMLANAGIKPDAPIQEVEKVDDPKTVVEEEAKTVIESKAEEVDEPPVSNEGEWSSEEEMLGHYHKEIGYDGEIQGSGLNAIIHSAKSVIDKYRDIAENPQVLEYLAHVEKGGNADTYAEMQGTNYYQDVEIDPSDTEQAENIAKAILIDLQNYDDQEELDKRVEQLKDSGEITDFNKKWFPKVQQLEKKANEEVKLATEKKIEKEQNEVKKYYLDLESSFNKTKLADVVVTPEVLNAVKALSVPDKSRKIGMADILDNLTPEQDAKMNLLAYSIVNNLPFTFNPTGKAKPTDKPILNILNKAKESNPKEVKTFGQFIKSKK